MLNKRIVYLCSIYACCSSLRRVEIKRINRCETFTDKNSLANASNEEVPRDYRPCDAGPGERRDIEYQNCAKTIHVLEPDTQP